MLKILIFMIVFIISGLAIKLLNDEILLYKNGIKKEATLVLMKPYNHVAVNAEKDKFYDFGIEPILEIEDNNKKIVIKYDDYSEFKKLNVGDKVKVIYPKENICKIKKYSFVSIFKGSIVLSLIDAIIIFIAISL